MLPIVHSGQAVFGAGQSDPYPLLSGVEPGLIVDVGAAAGLVTAEVLRNSPNSRVLAYEPFAGNWPHFEKTIGADARVELRRKALGGSAGTKRFYVKSVVQGTEPGWERLRGYSSLGYLVDDTHPLATEASSVPVARLDEEIDEHVRFLKIDVQGGELGVLRGAEKLLARDAVDMMFVEFRGEIEVLRLLHGSGFVVFDGAFMTLPRTRRMARLLSPMLSFGDDARETVAEFQLSTGQRTKREWLNIPWRTFVPYCYRIKFARLVMTIETDLLCVHRNYYGAFLSSLARSRRQVA